MRILLCNDDGYFAPGIELLARAIAGSRAIYARRHLPAFLASTELADAIRAWRSSSGT